MSAHLLESGFQFISRIHAVADEEATTAGIEVHTYNEDGIETPEAVRIPYYLLQRSMIDLAVRASSENPEVVKSLAESVTAAPRVYKPPYRQATFMPDGFAVVRGVVVPVDKEGNFNANR